MEEALHVSGAEAVADGLERGGVGTRSELVKSDPSRRAWRLAHSCPFQPHLGRVLGIGPGRRAQLSAMSVSPARTSEPDVRVHTHPALHQLSSSFHATCSSLTLGQGEGTRAAR